MGKSIFASLLAKAGNEYASKASEGIAAGDVTGYHDTGSYTLNAALGGSIFRGLPNNGVTALAGEPSTGKTFFALAVAKLFLQDNPDGEVFYFETESAMTVKSLERRGIDTERFNVLPVATVQDFRTQAVRIVDSYAEQSRDDVLPPMLFILDSLGGLSTDKEVADITSGEDKRDMTRAQLIRGAFRVLTLKLGIAVVPLIVTNHVYDVVGAYIPIKKMNGGAGLEYAASTIGFLSKTMDKDKTTKKTNGAIITVVIKKGRLTKENTKIECYLDFAEGLDRYYGLVDMAIEFGVFAKDGNYVKLPDGSKAYQSAIEENPTKYFTQEVLEAIDAKVQENFEYGGAKAAPAITVEAVEEKPAKKKKEVA